MLARPPRPPKLGRRLSLLSLRAIIAHSHPLTHAAWLGFALKSFPCLVSFLLSQGAVTDGNKAEFVSAKARLILVGSRRPALEALKDGFARALRDLSPGAAPFMGLLSHADWRVLLCGEEHVSGPQVCKNFVYSMHVTYVCTLYM